MSDIQNLNNYLCAIDDFLGDGSWTPNEEQWIKIRTKIRNMAEKETESDEDPDATYNRVIDYLENLERRVAAIENRAPQPAYEMHQTQANRPVVREPADLERVPPSTAPAGGMLPKATGNDFRAPGAGGGDGQATHTGQVSKTPSIDTSERPYESPLE